MMGTLCRVEQALQLHVGVAGITTSQGGDAKCDLHGPQHEPGAGRQPDALSLHHEPVGGGIASDCMQQGARGQRPGDPHRLTGLIR
jgi:hypothetical protein